MPRGTVDISDRGRTELGREGSRDLLIPRAGLLTNCISMKHKKQHWVPRSYLEAWTDPDRPAKHEPFVWVFSKDGSTSKRRAPSNLFTESDMYTLTLEDGTRDLSIEHGLSGLENAFAKIRRNIISKRRVIAGSEHLVVRAFMAAAHARSRLQRDHWQEQWRGILDDMKTLRRAMEEATPAQRKSMASLSLPGPETESLTEADVRRLADNPLQHTLVPVVQQQVVFLAPMTLTIFCTASEPGFITSDAPCVWFDPEAYKRPFPFNAPGLMYDTIEITLPVSPSQLAVLSRRDLPPYIDVPDHLVDEFNRRTRAHCQDEFVVRRNLTRPVWFDLGAPPEDA
jgi:hypothetical protein